VRVCSLLLVVGVAAGCGWVPADEQALTKFFEESRLYDTTRVADVARVVFDPRVEGVIERYTVVARHDEQPIDGNGLRRELTLTARVRTTGREYDRTLRVTMERDAAGRWMILAYRWTS
jgi:hypothetical protein